MSPRLNPPTYPSSSMYRGEGPTRTSFANRSGSRIPASTPIIATALLQAYGPNGGWAIASYCAFAGIVSALSAWWISTLPGLLVVLVGLGFVLIGDALGERLGVGQESMVL